MQLPQAFIHPEPGVHRRQGVCADGQADGHVLAVESTQPRHASLTNLALTVVEHPVRRFCRVLLIRLFGNHLDRISTHGRNVRSAGRKGQSKR